MKTVEEMIEVMQAFADGKEIEYSHNGSVKEEWNDNHSPSWHWGSIDYRIKELPKLEVDTKVLVGEGGVKRYFSHFEENGNICVFRAGETSWSSGGYTTSWKTWELA